MLYIDEDQNITLTRGDTGIFNISLQSQDGQAYIPQMGDTLRFALSEGFGKEALVIKNIPIETCILEIEPNDTKDLKFNRTSNNFKPKAEVTPIEQDIYYDEVIYYDGGDVHGYGDS